MKILLLGHNGMLGNAVYSYFLEGGYDIETIDNNCRWGEEEFKTFILDSNSELIINCIGAISQKKFKDEYFEFLNVELPIFLESTGKKVLHPSTDCIFSGKLEYPMKYDKDHIPDAYDVYGKSKARIDNLIIESFKNTKMIRTSIIGHELKNHVSLLDWFLTFPDGDAVNGYDNYYWNGITTLQWAMEAEKIVSSWGSYETLIQLGGNGISKLELLLLIGKVYSKENKVNSFKIPNDVNKLLNSDYELPTIEDQLIELKDFYKK